MPKPRSVEFGVPSGNDALSVRYGIEQGVFAREGLDLRVRIVFGGTELARAFDTGDLDIGSLGSPSGLNAMAAGASFRIIGSGCRRHAHLYLGVRPGIGGYDSLRGKRVGVLSLGSCPAWVVHRMLAHHALDPSHDVELVPLGGDYPRVVELLERGTLDACLATEPNLSIGESRNALRIWAAAYDPDCLPQFQWIVRVASATLIERDPELIHAVLRGCRRAARLAAERPEDFTRFVADYYRADPAAVRRAMRRELPLYELDGRLDHEGLQVSLDMLHSLGSIPEPAHADTFVAPGFCERLATP